MVSSALMSTDRLTEMRSIPAIEMITSPVITTPLSST
jgi:hypothetical protein